MATVVTPPAESAPAEPQPNFDIESWTSEQRDAWEETGSVPQSSPAESTPATPAGAAKADEPVTESAPATTQEHSRGKGADERKAQLNAEIQDLLKQRAELRAAVSKPVVAPASTAKEPKPERPVKPTFGDTVGETWEQFEVRTDAYHENLADYRAKEVLRTDREAREKERREADTQTANRVIEDNWKARQDAERTVNPAYDASLETFAKAKISPVIDGFLLDSDQGPKMVHYFASNLDKLADIAAMPPYKAARELVKIELSLTSGKAPVTPITKAPKPDVDITASRGNPNDPRTAAIEAGDFAAYQEIENRRDVQRRRGA